MALRGTNQESGRPYNRRIVLETIRLHGPIARGEIARKVGLTVQTVSTIIRELELQGLHHRRPRRSRVVAIVQQPHPQSGRRLRHRYQCCRRLASSSASGAGGHATSFEIYKCVSSPRCIRRTVFTVTSFPLGVLRPAAGRSSKGVYSTGLMNEFLWITWSGSILGHLDSQPAQEVVKWRGALRTS